MRSVRTAPLLFLLVSSFSAQAGESFASQCLEEYNQGHLEKALYYCHGAASNADAQYILGKLYSQEGMHSPEMKKALEYFSNAANLNQPDAQFMLALCYQNGIGVIKDPAKAITWYEEARNHGLDAPAFNPKWSRSNEQIIMENWPGAEELRTAAEKGNSEAEYQMGLLHANGNKVPQDDGKALFWLKKAADKNHSGAQSYLAWMNMLGLGKAENKDEAIQWFTKATQSEPQAEEIATDALDDLFNSLSESDNYLTHRSPQSEYLQGIELLSSRFSEQDIKDGLTLLEKASDENYVPAQIHLAKLYHDGNIVERDLKKAVNLYNEAALNGSHEAQYALGWMHFYGEGVPQNNEEAFEWFARANENESRAKEAMLFIEAQRPTIELGTNIVHEPIKVKVQRASNYLKSLLPTRKSSS